MKGSVPQLDASFPGCINGFLVAKKPGYRDAVSQITIKEPGLQIPHIDMTPLSLLKVKVVVVDGNVLRSLSKDELAVITIYNPELDHEDTAFYPQQHKDLKNQDILEIIKDDTTYELDVKLVKDQVPIGGYYESSWNVTYSQLDGAVQITVYAYKMSPEPGTLQDFIPQWKSIRAMKNKEYKPIIS